MTTATIRKPAICANCDKLKPNHALGLCRLCWVYQWRHKGEPRPDYLINPPLFCTDCKENYAKIKGKCRPCHDSRKHSGGRKRRKHVRDREVLCRNQNCRKPLDLDRNPIGGKCYNCYVYGDRKQKRPLRLCRFLLEPGYVYCRNPHCDQVLKETSSQRRGKRCRNCYTWRRRNPETDRPREYCPQRIEWGWCDGCGEIAVAEVELNIGVKGKTKIKMPLCQTHLDELV